MAEYILNRNYVHCSTGGVLSFIKGEATFVPPHLEREVRALGGERVDGDNPEVLDPETEPPAPMSISDRNDAIVTAFEIITRKNESKEFTGAGVPTVKAVERLTGFDVERAEVDALWQSYRLEKAAEA